MAATAAESLARDLRRLVGDDGVLTGGQLTPYLVDATEPRGVRGRADALALPRNAEEVAAVVAYCYREQVAIVPRGGGTGFAGGAVADGGVLLALERLDRVLEMEPLRWRMRVEAGVTTRRVQQLARESGLRFPPDPGAPEQSQIGGNVATNAGGPHAFKYGVTGAFVMGLEAVVPPGEPLRLGGSTRKDVAGYDLLHLLVGSEGTLGVVTETTLRLIPAAEAAYPVLALLPDAEAAGLALEAALASGTVPAAVEYFDDLSWEIARRGFPAELPGGYVLICEADGSAAEAASGRDLLREALDEHALQLYAPTERAEIAALWRWREGVSFLVDAYRGGKLSEDIAVPLERLFDAVARTREIAARHGVECCSFGHGGDGNLHSCLLFDRGDEEARLRAEAAAQDLLGMAVELGGTISGEHGLGTLKNGWLRHQWSPAAVRLHEAVKRTFDPEGLMNPGKKLA
jgi:glycolate oxidase subunit GlcD